MEAFGCRCIVWVGGARGSTTRGEEGRRQDSGVADAVGAGPTWPPRAVHCVSSSLLASPLHATIYCRSSGSRRAFHSAIASAIAVESEKTGTSIALPFAIRNNACLVSVRTLFFFTSLPRRVSPGGTARQRPLHPLPPCMLSPRAVLIVMNGS
ncbi:hypothetical protein OBBRIDRAFT_496651 [Obba rivulosa]|uniref:Uncharacterized protein n=1 Tax=Obba rivulosa TaxID=1052685 RepID=A0A8E2DU37_9APHY|nr:hypothetical protein OBBRIDRAFT_496651 [Obba rivulosa]